MADRIVVIAEAGVNHNGSLERALELIDAAADAGADIVKFQTFNSEAVISRFATKAEYQLKATGSDESQLEMVRKLELDANAHRTLVAHCAKRAIRFLSTPFDLQSLHFLADELNVERIKLPSGEITNGPLLLEAARTGKPVIVSTGMCSLGEIEAALGVLSFGYIGGQSPPSTAAFEAAYRSPEGLQALQKNVVLLHCTTEYPAPIAEVNLRAMAAMRAAFGLPVGYSDHSEGIAVPIAAAALGASIIEKHFTLDRSLPGPDHKASLEPPDLTAMVAGIRQVEQALGSGLKIPGASELKNRPVARKSLVASRPIQAGETFVEDNLTAKRPGQGVSPMQYWDYLGQTAARDLGEDEAL